jgi:tetratricopeptide (TPR) repeat protein
MLNNLPKPTLFDVSAPSLAKLKYTAESANASSQDRLNYANALIQFGDVERAADFLSSNLADDRCMSRLREYYIGERMHAHALTLVQRFEREKGISSKIDEAIRSHLSGDHKQALAQAREAIAINPDHAEAYNHAARALFNMRLIQEAYIHFSKSLQINPNSPETWHNIAHLLRAGGHFEQAEQAYSNALKLAPNYVSALVNSAVIKIGKNEANQAQPLLQKALKLNPNHAEAHLNSGICEQALGNLATAKMHYQHSIRIDPHNPFAFRHLASLLKQLGEESEAINHIQESIRLNPADIESWVEFLTLINPATDIDQYFSYTAQAKTYFPDDSNLLFLEAKAVRTNGDNAASAEILKSIDPNRLFPKVAYDYFFELGKALDQNNQFNAACNAYFQAKQIGNTSLRAKNIDKKMLPAQIIEIDRWLDNSAKSILTNEQGDQGEDLCFFIGFPESSLAIVDEVLNSQNNVLLLNEVPAIEHVGYQLSDHPSGFPHAIKSINHNDLDALRLIYRNVLKTHQKSVPPGGIVIDKMLFRTHLAGFIQRIFPKAKFLFALRHPCDSILACFMQRFPVNEGTIHLSSIESAVNIYDQVMQCWVKTNDSMKVNFHYLRYEDGIEKPASLIEGLCAFLKLSERENLSGYSTHASAHGHWKNYKSFFEPHREVLQPHLDYFGYGWDD